jgi:hypothetical protein
MRLEDAITLMGTCTDMCPEFEREERDYQGEADVFERVSVFGLGRLLLFRARLICQPLFLSIPGPNVWIHRGP